MSGCAVEVNLGFSVVLRLSRHAVRCPIT